jgi:quinol-cytochrome oxidoreductase complex cytochrome b subunit
MDAFVIAGTARYIEIIIIQNIREDSGQTKDHDDITLNLSFSLNYILQTFAIHLAICIHLAVHYEQTTSASGLSYASLGPSRFAISRIRWTNTFG